MEENSSSILVVDDNPEIREIIQVLLGGEGYLVETAGNALRHWRCWKTGSMI